MASKRQRDLDRLIESAGARVYDEETGRWSHGESDESGWGLSSITNFAKKGITMPLKLAVSPYTIARRGMRMLRRPSQPAQQAYQSRYQQTYQQPYPQQDYPQGGADAYQDPGSQDPGYQDQSDYYPDQGY